MRKLHYKYRMKIEYSELVSRCNFTIKCIPKDTRRQFVDNVNISVSPKTRYRFGRDGFNNTQIYGVNDKPHKVFVFTIEGDATTGVEAFEEYSNPDLDMIFKHPYGLCKPGKFSEIFLSRLDLSKSGNEFLKATEVMHELYKEMHYESGCTNNETTAEEALAQKRGVCQDYAHIYIALMHLLHIPARYVTGFVLGEGASHAWVEILIRNKWYGMDPTNDKIVLDEHIKIGVGRDANDCQINRGIMYGGGLHVQLIKVNVKEIER